MTSESQQEELEVLQSIYEGDPNFKEQGARTFQYKYGDDGHPHSILVEITWPENYPDALPDINMDAFYNKHIHESVKAGIKNRLLAEAENNLGCAMTFTLFEWIKEHLEELLMDQPLVVESHLDKLELKDKEDAACAKESKERRVVMTKSQKRRQWDRMDGKGEKPRGYDWVDVIKHLSQTGGSSAVTSHS